FIVLLICVSHFRPMSPSTTTLDELSKPSSPAASTQTSKELTLNIPRKLKLKGKLSKDYIVGFSSSFDQKTYEPANYKQLVAYYFIKNCCTGLQFISLNIRVLTTDQGTNFIGFSKKMNVSLQLNFYKFDQHLNRLAPKLTDAHINPSPFQKMKVRYSSQIFSATVAAGMRICIEGGILSPIAEITLMFIDYMDKLFDILNSKPKTGNVFKCMRVLETNIVNGELVNNYYKFFHCDGAKCLDDLDQILRNISEVAPALGSVKLSDKNPFSDNVLKIDTVDYRNLCIPAKNALAYNNVGKELRNVVDNVPFDYSCPDFDIDFIKKLYIRLRIFHGLKTLNKNALSAPRKNLSILICASTVVSPPNGFSAQKGDRPA
ncbi:hypothetical protein QTP88_029430, partial [Uroleucon formosanum]